ncbi:MAG: hypothetical protein AB8G99_04240, partial [Planctomycetaceae bacterium]
PANRIQSAEELANLLEPFAENADLANLVRRVDGHSSAIVPTQRMDGPEDATDDDTAHVVSMSGSLDRSDATVLEADQVSVSVKPETKSRRSATRTVKAMLIGLTTIGLVAALAFAIQQRFKVETPAGTLIVETSGKELPITIAGKSVTFKDPSDGKPVRVTVDEDRKLLVFTKDGFKAVSKSVDLESDNGQRVSLTFEPKPAKEVAGISQVDVAKVVRSPREVVESAFSKGVFAFVSSSTGSVTRKDEIPENPSTIYHVAIRNDRMQETRELLQELRKVLDLSSVSIHGPTPLDEETVNVLASMPRAGGAPYLHAVPPPTDWQDRWILIRSIEPHRPVRRSVGSPS